MALGSDEPITRRDAQLLDKASFSQCFSMPCRERPDLATGVLLASANLVPPAQVPNGAMKGNGLVELVPCISGLEQPGKQPKTFSPRRLRFAVLQPMRSGATREQRLPPRSDTQHNEHLLHIGVILHVASQLPFATWSVQSAIRKDLFAALMETLDEPWPPSQFCTPVAPQSPEASLAVHPPLR